LPSWPFGSWPTKHPATTFTS